MIALLWEVALLCVVNVTLLVTHLSYERRLRQLEQITQMLVWITVARSSNVIRQIDEIQDHKD